MTQKLFDGAAENWQELADASDAVATADERVTNGDAAWLTAREMQIAAQVCRGKLNKQIAAHLNISEHTVNTHLRRIYCKLGVRNRAGLVGRCLPLLHYHER